MEATELLNMFKEGRPCLWTVLFLLWIADSCSCCKENEKYNAEPFIEFPGVVVPSAEECQKLCWEYPTCQFFNYEYLGIYQTCRLIDWSEFFSDPSIEPSWQSIRGPRLCQPPGKQKTFVYSPQHTMCDFHNFGLIFAGSTLHCSKLIA